MAMKPHGKPGLEDDSSPIHRIRITLTSRNVKNLEKGAPWAHMGALPSSASLFSHSPWQLCSLLRHKSVRCLPKSTLLSQSWLYSPQFVVARSMATCALAVAQACYLYIVWRLVLKALVSCILH